MKSWYIRGHAFQRVGGGGEFGNCVHAFIDRPALPVPILVGLHLIEAVIDADGLVHVFRL